MRYLARIAAATLLLISPAIGQELAGRTATVSVEGRGEVELKPDFARILVAVVTTGETVSQAVEANREASERVLARIQALGIKREDIHTANFQVFQTPPRRAPDGSEIQVPKFTASHQIRMTSRDVAGVGRLTGEILALGNDTMFQSLSWGLDRPREAGDQARREAVRDARRQAEVYADASGAQLNRLVEIRDGAVHALEAQPDMPMRMNAAAGAPPLPIVPPAQVRYTAAVHMVWEITPRSP